MSCADTEESRDFGMTGYNRDSLTEILTVTDREEAGENLVVAYSAEHLLRTNLAVSK